MISRSSPTSFAESGSVNTLAIRSACSAVESTSRRRLTTHQMRVGAVRSASARSACDASHYTAISRQAVLPTPVGTPTSAGPRGKLLLFGHFLGQRRTLRKPDEAASRRYSPLDSARNPHGACPVSVLVEDVAFLDFVGPLATGQRLGVEGDMADEVEGVEVRAEFLGDGIKR